MTGSLVLEYTFKSNPDSWINTNKLQIVECQPMKFTKILSSSAEHRPNLIISWSYQLRSCSTFHGNLSIFYLEMCNTIQLVACHAYTHGTPYFVHHFCRTYFPWKTSLWRYREIIIKSVCPYSQPQIYTSVEHHVLKRWKLIESEYQKSCDPFVKNAKRILCAS